MAKHVDGGWAKIATVYVALALLFLGLSSWVGAKAVQRTDTETTSPSSPANNVGYEPVTPGDWTTVPREVGTALDALAGRSVGGGTGSMTTVKSGGVQVGGADIVTLDFSSVFTVAEAPDTEINISIPTSVTAGATLDAAALVVGDGARGLSSVGIKAAATTLTGLSLIRADTGGADPNLLVLSSAGDSAVNYFSLANHVTGNAPIMAASGEANTGLQFWDSNSREIVVMASVASAVNELTIANAATTNDPSITASGETNVGIIIASKGTGVVSVPGVGTGGLTDYDLTVGNTSDYGIMQVGNFSVGRSSYKAGAVDFDGTVLFRNLSAPATGPVEFAFAMTGGTSLRFAIAKAAVGNATYNSRSLLCAGPAPASTAAVTVAHWQGTGIFDNLVCDTAGDGADLGVQNDLEVEGDIFTDSILESTTAAGVTIDGVLLKDGEVDGRNVGDLLAFFNGTFIESFNALATSDGATVTMSIEQDGGGDLTMNFSDGQTILDCTPAATIALTAGSDTSPTDNFIYVLQSTKVLTKSTSDWPSAEHIKVGFFLAPSAGFVQTKGVYINHNTNDHAQGTNGQGHLVHITERLRADHAIYRSGGDLTITIGGGGTTVDVAVTAGVVRQMHKHATPAMDTATGDAILILNQNGAAFDPVTDLELLTNDANGVAVKKYFNWLIAAVANKGGEYSPLIMNLPTGSYNKQQSAETDVDGYDVFGLPSEYDVESATGFLIARVTMSKIGGTWAHVSTVDLRGTNPQSATGGVGGVTTEFADNAWHLFDESDVTKEMDFQLSGLTTGNTRTITMADADVDLSQMVTLTGTQTLTNKTLTTPTIGSFANAGHTHLNAAGGGTVTEAAISDLGAYLENIVEDTTPQLGADLECEGFRLNNWERMVGTFDGNSCKVTLNTYGTAARFGIWDTNTAGGSLDTPTAVGSTRTIGRFNMKGHDGTSFVSTARLEGIVDGTVTTGTVPISLAFSTGTTTPLVRFTLRSDGHTQVSDSRRWQFRNANNAVWSPGTNTLSLLGGGTLRLDLTANTLQFWKDDATAIGTIDCNTLTEMKIQSANTSDRIRIDNTGVGINGAAGVAPPTYTVTNPSTSRSLDVSTATLAQLRAIVGTMIADQQTFGAFQ
jgi:hypothetical protein